MAWPPTTHQDVQDDLTNGHGWATTLTQRLALGEQFIATGGPLWIAGRYYGSGVSGTSTSNAMAASRLYLTAFYAPRSRTIDRIGVNVTVAGAAGNVARCGIWNADPDTGQPTTVLLDGGTLSVATTGVKESTVSTTISGLVWLGVTAQGGTMSAYSSTQMPNVVGAPSLSPGANVSIGLDAIDPTVALPTMVGASISYGITSSPPAVMIRAA